jgi:hypothetical protein
MSAERWRLYKPEQSLCWIGSARFDSSRIGWRLLAHPALVPLVRRVRVIHVIDVAQFC